MNKITIEKNGIPSVYEVEDFIFVGSLKRIHEQVAKKGITMKAACDGSLGGVRHLLTAFMGVMYRRGESERETIQEVIREVLTQEGEIVIVKGKLHMDGEIEEYGEKG